MKYASAKEVHSVTETEGRDATIIVSYLAVSTVILLVLYMLSNGQAPDITQVMATGVFP